jgi:hypothetical protein
MNTATKHLSWAILATASTACGGCGSSPAPQPMMQPMQAPPPMMVAPQPVQTGPCDQAQSLATSTSIAARAAAEAPGMKPEGQAHCAVVPEGQAYVSQIFTIEQGYCYTFLGQSLPPVGAMEMVLQGDASGLIGGLLPGMGQAAQAPLLVSTSPGERVNMGERQSCYQWAFPVPATVKLILKVRAGAGPVAAQAFRKKTF